MGEVINLRQARKARERKAAEAAAAEARARHGRTKGEKKLAEAEAERLTRAVEQSKLEGAPGSEPPVRHSREGGNPPGGKGWLPGGFPPSRE